ncbi:unnamed protein product [Protopolystoma xenopodis]|uniref:Uncharacterized protein n=1 Tax=Protopolystoma xenopodis TaxID=117903 RepID=A0A448X8P3_9PLAT|nr:unnamed protein product [Protopolystoma xenopodis]
MYARLTQYSFFLPLVGSGCSLLTPHYLPPFHRSTSIHTERCPTALRQPGRPLRTYSQICIKCYIPIHTNMHTSSQEAVYFKLPQTTPTSTDSTAVPRLSESRARNILTPTGLSLCCFTRFLLRMCTYHTRERYDHLNLRIPKVLLLSIIYPFRFASMRV